MDLIRIIWLTDEPNIYRRKQRASFEMPAGDFEAASRIFAEMIKRLKAEKEDEERKNLGPNRHESERGGESR